MDREQLLKAARALLKRLPPPTKTRDTSAAGAKAEISEFLRRFAGPKNSFFIEASEVIGDDSLQRKRLRSILESFIAFVEAGLLAEISPERQAQLEVVSDVLAQAQRLLEERRVHPASAVMLIGAGLEEYLRNWCLSIPLSLGQRKPSIQAYAEVLRIAELLTAQDVKDITSWAGMRNHAAHGEWTQVSDRQRIRLMLDGVNLFMRKYGG